MADLRVEKGRTTRDRLIEAARELFGERGYEATSIEAILEAAGVARGALYHHFSSKEAVFDAVLDRTIRDITRATAEAARGLDDPAASLRAGCVEWLRLAADPAIQRIVLIDPPSVVGWTRWREIDEQHTLGAIKKALSRLADAGRIEPETVDLLAHMVLAAVDEAALYVARSSEPAAALEQGEAVVERLLDRLLSADRA